MKVTLTIDTDKFKGCETSELRHVALVKALEAATQDVRSCSVLELERLLAIGLRQTLDDGKSYMGMLKAKGSL